MEIGKEIKQNKFKNEYHKMFINILFTSGWLAAKDSAHLKPYGISTQQFNILRILRGQYPKPATVNLLKERMLDKMSDASRIVDRLVHKGLVSRCTNTKDRRAVDIRVSDAGRDVLTKMDAEFKTKDFLKNNLTDEEAAALSNLLDKLRG